jgi:WD40 repeat protein
MIASAPIFTRGETATSVAYSPDSRRIVIGFNSGALQVLDVHSSHVLDTVHLHSRPIVHVAFSNNGTAVLSGGADGVVWRVSSIRSFSESLPSTVVRSQAELSYSKAALSPNGALVAFAGRSEGTQIFDSETGRSIGALNDSRSEPQAVSWSADGNWLVTIAGGKALIWNAHTMLLERTIQGRTRFLNAMAVSPDGRRLAVSSAGVGMDISVVIFDLKSGEQLHVLGGF